jgi:hypothetical protein
VHAAIIVDHQKLHIHRYRLQKVIIGIIVLSEYEYLKLETMQFAFIRLLICTHPVCPKTRTTFNAAEVTITHCCQMVKLQFAPILFIPQSVRCKALCAIIHLLIQM